jgi:hypothetical protein
MASGEMNELTAVPAAAAFPHDGRTAVWPSPGYARQVAALRRRVGQPIFIAEVSFNGLSIGAVLHSEPRILLAVADFPRPDPSRGLYPHMLVLDDGRGINLGRVARVTAGRAFDPNSEHVLYGDRALQQRTLYRARRLSVRRIAAIVRGQLRVLLGRPSSSRAIERRESA